MDSNSTYLMDSALSKLIEAVNDRVKSLESASDIAERLSSALLPVEPLLLKLATNNSSSCSKAVLFIRKNLVLIHQILENYENCLKQSWVVRLYYAGSLERNLSKALDILDRSISTCTLIAVSSAGDSIPDQGSTVSDSDDMTKDVDLELLKQQTLVLEKDIESAFIKSVRSIFADAIRSLKDLSIGGCLSVPLSSKPGAELVLSNVVFEGFTTHSDTVEVQFTHDGLKVFFHKIIANTQDFMWSIILPEESESAEMLSKVGVEAFEERVILTGTSVMTLTAVFSIEFTATLDEKSHPLYQAVKCMAHLQDLEVVELDCTQSPFLFSMAKFAFLGAKETILQNSAETLTYQIESELLPELNQVLSSQSDSVLENFQALLQQQVNERDRKLEVKVNEALMKEKADRIKKEELEKERLREARIKELQGLERGVEELWEWQRWLPVKGWVAAFATPPHYTNASRSEVHYTTDTMNSVCSSYEAANTLSASAKSASAKQWYWLDTDWKTEDWQYAIGFRVQAEYTDNMKMGSVVRRRKLVRRRVFCSCDDMNDMIVYAVPL